MIRSRLDALMPRGAGVNAPKNKIDTHTEFQSSLVQKTVATRYRSEGCAKGVERRLTDLGKTIYLSNTCSVSRL